MEQSPGPRGRRHAARVVAAAVALGAVLTACADATPQVMADYSWYEDVGALVDESDLVVIGTATGSRDDVSYPLPIDSDDPQLNPLAGVEPDDVEPAEDDGVPIRVHPFAVEEVLVGEPAQPFEVGVTRGTAEDDGQLGSGERVLLFLSVVDGHPAWVLGGRQGRFVEADDGTWVTTEPGHDDLAITLDALRELVED